MDNTILILTGSGIIFFGIITAAIFSYRIFQAISSTKWPSVIGNLESAELKEVIYRGRDAGGGVDQAGALVVNFRYRYSVADMNYVGKRVTYSDGINKTVRAVKKLQDKYKGKSEVQVYYNPKNPKQSVLVPGPSVFNFTPLITSTLFLLAGIFFFIHDFQ
jgi:hypothetical protein